MGINQTHLFFKYKLKLYYFHKWKCRALYNRDLIDEEDPFNVKSGVNYNQFKNMNYGGQPGILDSLNSNLYLKNSSLINIRYFSSSFLLMAISFIFMKN